MHSNIDEMKLPELFLKKFFDIEQNVFSLYVSDPFLSEFQFNDEFYVSAKIARDTEVDSFKGYLLWNHFVYFLSI